MIHSEIQVGGSVSSFPTHTGERVYMVPFYPKDGVPRELARWQSVVDNMLEDVWVVGPVYLMIDQGIVEAGATHRRSGLHVDGNWKVSDDGHRHPFPAHRHPQPHPSQKKPIDGHHQHRQSHVHGGEYQPELLILTSNTSAACRAFAGTFDGVPGPDGNCSHIDCSAGHEVLFESGRVYRGNATLVHESLPVPFRCARALVRLNVPGAQLPA